MQRLTPDGASGVEAAEVLDVFAIHCFGDLPFEAMDVVAVEDLRPLVMNQKLPL